MGLTVVTHHNTSKNRNLDKCVESVANALPENAKHVIVECTDHYADFVKARYAALSLDDIIVFVDDDDYVSKESLKLCMSALDNTTAGIAFTREVKVRTDGTRTVNTAPTYCRSMLNGPESVHHMTAIRTASVSERSLLLGSKYMIGIEWFMRADAAFAHGAVHVPVDGYYWVQHPAQHHRAADQQHQYRTHIHQIKKEMLTWSINFDKIEVWPLTNRSQT